MSRLIDADMLKEQIKSIHMAVDASAVNNDYDTGFHSSTSQIQGLVDYMPTVYDVDKVVEQVKEIGKRFCILTHCSGECADCDHGAIMKAIISKIKAGGIDE